MAEIVGLVASAVTLAATAQGAAHLSKVVFKVVSTFKNAPKEMAAIARELSQFSGSLHTLADIIDRYETLCKPAAFESIRTIIRGYRELETDLKKIIDTDTPEKLLKLRWCMQKPKAKNILRRIEGIKAALTLELVVFQLAKEQVTRMPDTKAVASQSTAVTNRWRSVVESVVQANRQVVEDAQHEEIEDAVQYHKHLEGKRTELDLWKEGSFDTATWLYHLVFSPSVQDPPFQATVTDESPERQGGIVSLRSESQNMSKNTSETITRDMIVWNARTEPSYVVDRLLFTWTTLSHEQISLSSAHQDINSAWSERALEMLEEAKREVEQETISGSEGEYEQWDAAPPMIARTRTRRAVTSNSHTSSAPRPHVRFETATQSPSRDGPEISHSSARSTISRDSVPTVYTIDSDDSMRTRRGRSTRWSAEDNDSWSSKKKGSKDNAASLDISVPDPEPMLAPPSPKANETDPWAFESNKTKKDKKKGSADVAPALDDPNLRPDDNWGDWGDWGDLGGKKKKKKGKKQAQDEEAKGLKREGEEEEEEVEAKVAEEKAERMKKEEDETAAAAAPYLSWANDPPAIDDWAFGGTTSKKKKKKRKSTVKEAEGLPAVTLDDNRTKQPYVESISEPKPSNSTPTNNADFTDDAGTTPVSDWYQRNFQDSTRYSHPLYRSHDKDYAWPIHPSNLSWNPFAYPNIDPVSAAYSTIPHPPPPPPGPHAESMNDPRISRIEELLASQQDCLAQIKDNKTPVGEETTAKHLWTATSECNKTIRELARSLGQQKEIQQKVEADLAAERKYMLAVAEEKLAIIRGLERLVTQREEDQRKAEERWQVEKQVLQNQVAEVVEMKEAALKDVATAQSATKAMHKSLELLQMQAEAEKKSRMENEIKVAEARRKSDEDNKERFQHYERMLKTSKEASKREERDMQRPVRQTLIKDHNRSIEVNEYTAEALGSSLPSTSLPLKFFYDDFRRSEADIKYNDRPWPKRERHNSFLDPSRSMHLSGISFAGSSNQSTVQQSQQTVVFSSRANVNTARMSQLRKSLARSGVHAIMDGTQESSHDEMVLYNSNGKQLVRSTVFWEAPALALGSELLLTLRESGWKPNYSRKSAGGRTYFLGEQPVHSYFFQDHYSPQFTPPTSFTEHDAVVIDKALIEEYALMELGFDYHLTATGEYELDGRLTFGDLESLIERSFLMKENNYRRQYRQLQGQYQPQPSTPFTTTTFERNYAPSTISTISKSSRQSDASTELGHTEDDGFDTSQTSHQDFNDGNSVYDGDRDTVISPSVAPRPGTKSTNPFHAQAHKRRTKTSNNPWAKPSIWGGD